MLWATIIKYLKKIKGKTEQIHDASSLQAVLSKDASDITSHTEKDLKLEFNCISELKSEASTKPENYIAEKTNFSDTPSKEAASEKKAHEEGFQEPFYSKIGLFENGSFSDNKLTDQNTNSKNSLYDRLDGEYIKQDTPKAVKVIVPGQNIEYLTLDINSFGANNLYLNHR